MNKSEVNSTASLDKAKTSIVWFRRDLRLSDNPAYSHGVKKGPVIAVYTLCQKQWNQHDLAKRQRSLIVEHLHALERSLSKQGIPLVVIDAGNFDSVPAALVKFSKENNCCDIQFNQEYELNERNLTASVIKAFNDNGLSTKVFHDQCLIEPGRILNKQGQPYKVFSAFKKAYLSELNSLMRPLYGKPRVHAGQVNIKLASDIRVLASIEKNELHRETLILNEQQAHELLNEFCADRITDYQIDRDLPAVEGTSRLSACLATGLLSVRQSYQAAHQHNSEGGFVDQEGITTWINELVWRDFYRHLLFLFPNLCKHEPFKLKTNALPWKHDKKLFAAWTQGRTGYPIVDAAMRQLNATGWMHNRLRMVTAMFLTKHLFIDWRWGEKYFMENLIDADLASNNGGWQWSASTGVDAVPYFRIFNPTRQSQRFDTTGLFIRQYVPELASLDNKSIHSPSREQVEKVGYIHPIVDHASSVKQTKSWFKGLDSSIKL
jgi:deoxyribodipyrimidine photo-lyase